MLGDGLSDALTGPCNDYIHPGNDLVRESYAIMAVSGKVIVSLPLNPRMYMSAELAYSHLFFDLDHTLWDFETNSRETLKDLFHETDLPGRGIADFDEFHDVYHHHNTIFWDRFRKGFITREELRWKRMWRTLVDFRIPDEKLAKLMSERYLEILPTKKNLFEDTLDVLAYLRAKGYPMHLITNGFEKTQHAKMRHSGIDHFFTHVITSEAAGIMKPHVAIFEYALEMAGVKANDTVMVGDTLDADIEGAIRAGMDTIYFNPAVPATGAIKPTYSILSLRELKKIL
jgi:putative hydrolase of the HAD superfamily